VYLTNRDIRWAITAANLIVTHAPEELGAGYDETSIDLHLDSVDEAQVWNVAAYLASEQTRGRERPELFIGNFDWAPFSEQYLTRPPEDDGSGRQVVSRRGREVVVRPTGFLLWTTKEVVGTPARNPQFVCFVNAKSTRARTGIIVHFTAPTIHAGWSGKIVLEIANLGPFDIVLRENDVIAQLPVATVSSPPDLALKRAPSQTDQQTHAGVPPPRTRRRRRGR
jgi:dCTP deaminase